MNNRFQFNEPFDRQALQLLQVPIALGLFLAWQHNARHAGDKGLFFTTFLGFFWCLIYTVMVTRDRCSELELALPLSGVRIWKNHVFSSLVQTAAHVALFLVPVTLICEPYIIRQYLTTGGYVLPGLIFTGALVHRIEPGCNRVRNTGQLNGAVVAGLIVTVLLLVFRSPWFSLLTVVAAGLLLLAASRRVRESLTLVDDRPEPKGGYGSLGRWEPASDERGRSTPVILKGPARAGRRLSTLWMLGILNLRQYSLIADIFGFLILTSLGGALVMPGVGFGTVIVSLLSTLIILNVLSAEQNRSGSPYAHLPLPRRRLHAALLLPLLAAVGSGAVVQVGFLLANDTYPGFVHVSERKDDGETSYFIQVPPQFRCIAWDGQPPVVVDSNGDTHTTTMFMTKMSYDDQDGPVIYNPFEVGHGASKAFAVEQYTRAVKAVYGIDLDPERAELFMTRYQGRLDTVEGLTLSEGPQRIALSIIIFSVVWSLLAAGNSLISRWVPRARVRKPRQNVQALVLAGLALVLTVLFIVMKTSAGTLFWLIYFVSVVTSQLAAKMPGPILSLGAALACLAGAWLLSRQLFTRRELLPGQS